MGDNDKRKDGFSQTGFHGLDEPDFLKEVEKPLVSPLTEPVLRHQEEAQEEALLPDERHKEAPRKEPQGIMPGRNFMGIPTEKPAAFSDPFAKLKSEEPEREEKEGPEKEVEQKFPKVATGEDAREVFDEQESRKAARGKKRSAPTAEEAKAMAVATERINGARQEAPVSEKERRRRLSQQRRVRKERRKRRIIAFLLSLVLLAGLAYLDVPYAFALRDERNALRSIEEYSMVTSQLDSSTTWEKLVAARDYNERLLKRRQNMDVNPYDMVFDEKATYDDQDVRYLFHLEYVSLLKADPSRIMGYISIPKLWISLPIYYGYNEQDMKNGICHLEWTSLPVGGGSSHSVLLGYAKEGKKRLFSNLDLLQKGDVFYVHEMNRTLNYRVTSIKEAYLGDVDALEIQKSKDLLSLVAVKPQGSSLKRLYVTASRIGNVDDPDNIPYPMALLRDWWWAALTVLVLFFWFLFVRSYTHPERKHLKKMRKEKKAKEKRAKKEALKEQKAAKKEKKAIKENEQPDAEKEKEEAEEAQETEK